MRVVTYIVLVIGLLTSMPVRAALGVQEIKTQNATAWLIEDHTLPLISVRVEYDNSGVAYDPLKKDGLANFVMLMMDEGAGDLDSLAFNHALEDDAIKLGAEADADNAVFTLQTMSEFKDKAFTLFTTALTHPRFDAPAIERIRASLLSTIKQSEQNPAYIASLEWKKAAFNTHPYAHAKIGSADTVVNITREDLVAFHKALLCQKKIISITGDIRAEEVKQFLATLPVVEDTRCVRNSIADVAVKEGNTAPIQVTKEVPQTIIYASIPALGREDPNYYTLVVLNQILGGSSLSSRLGLEIRDKRGLAYYADSTINVLAHAHWLSMHFATRLAQADEALQVFLNTLHTVAQAGFTVSEVSEAKSYLTGSFPLNLDSQGALTGYLNEMQKHHLGQDYLEKRNQFINNVTVQSVNDLTKQLISDKHAPLIIRVGTLEKKKVP